MAFRIGNRENSHNIQYLSQAASHNIRYLLYCFSECHGCSLGLRAALFSPWAVLEALGDDFNHNPPGRHGILPQNFYPYYTLHSKRKGGFFLSPYVFVHLLPHSPTHSRSRTEGHLARNGSNREKNPMVRVELMGPSCSCRPLPHCTPGPRHGQIAVVQEFRALIFQLSVKREREREREREKTLSANFCTLKGC